MPKKRFNAEQIVTLLRQIEVSIAQGRQLAQAVPQTLTTITDGEHTLTTAKLADLTKARDLHVH